MSASKRPSTSSLRRFITTRPYVPVAELRRRFNLDEPDAMAHIQRNGTSAWIGLPEREAVKLQDLWERDEVGLELSVEVHAPVIVGVYPMRIARYVTDAANATGQDGAARDGEVAGNGGGRYPARGDGDGRSDAPRRSWTDRKGPRRWPGDGAGSHPHAPRPMSGAPAYGSRQRGGPPEDATQR